jgi:hypothetical protein
VLNAGGSIPTEEFLNATYRGSDLQRIAMVETYQRAPTRTLALALLLSPRVLAAAVAANLAQGRWSLVVRDGGLCLTHRATLRLAIAKVEGFGDVACTGLEFPGGVRHQGL